MQNFKEYLFEQTAKEQARSMGLHYMGFGRWGKDGQILYKTYYGKLIKSEPKEVKTKNSIPKGLYKDDNLVYIKKAFDSEVEGDSQFHANLDTKNPGADCLLRQIIHTVSIQSGKSPEELLSKFNPNGHELFGHTLDTIVSGLNDSHDLDIKVYQINNIDDAIKVLHEGTPVVAVFDAYGPLMLSAERGGKKVREYKKTGDLEIYNYKDGPKGTMYHSFLLVGYDKKAGRVIFRDTSPNHGFKGYVRVKYTDLKSRPDLISRYMEVKV